ncbi:SnoaL-like domain-containing protein [Abditibacterium utsteinense]|uniref:SnoaL-like domain-containing protein n=1 Tax=Abditibacterium utsteinense TaxID=1960156 RepID=A0A2S8SU69_9BACT|nr:nuclear transport factor 2 family protein [Abditibacterium utsteinense]PQV64344.1 SnoaL-like domain-containing protein [Abditibacterium utsteinense]
METTQIEAKAKEFIDALHALEQGRADDANQLAALFAQNATLRNAALDNKEAEIKGADQILRFWIEYKETLGEVFSRFHHVIASDKAAGLFWTTTGVNPAGEAVNYHGSTLLQFGSEGKIEFFRGYYDTRELVVKSDS